VPKPWAFVEEIALGGGIKWVSSFAHHNRFSGAAPASSSETTKNRNRCRTRIGRSFEIRVLWATVSARVLRHARVTLSACDGQHAEIARKIPIGFCCAPNRAAAASIGPKFFVRWIINRLIIFLGSVRLGLQRGRSGFPIEKYYKNPQSKEEAQLM
jgi:hypothetical protein